jgi:hypothetical protein
VSPGRHRRPIALRVCRALVLRAAATLRRARRALGYLPFFRAFVAMEATLLALAAAIVDAATGTLDGTRTLVLALIPVAAITAGGHLLAILTSDRLR